MMLVIFVIRKYEELLFNHNFYMILSIKIVIFFLKLSIKIILNN